MFFGWEVSLYLISCYSGAHKTILYTVVSADESGTLTREIKRRP